MPSYPGYRPPAQSNNGGSVLDIILRRGDYAADLARQNGAIWGNALAGAGQILAGGIQQHAEENQRKKQSIAFEAAIQSGDPRQIISVLGPERGPAVVTALSAHSPDGMKRYTDRMTLGRDQARGILAVPEDMRPQAYSFARQGLIQAGAFKPEELPEDFGEAMPIISQVANYGADPSKTDDTAVVGGALVNKRTGQPIYTAPKEEKRPEVGTFGDYVVRRFGTNPSPEQIEQAKKTYGQADDRPRITIDTGGGGDVKEAVTAMKEGTVPPQLPGRSSKEYIAVMAEARRQGYNLAEAATDWTATQKHIATLNGSQQTRMAQAIDNAKDSLDVIDNLADKWKGGKFPILNKAQLAAAKGGALGPEAQKIATQLEAQISDVTSELGNVYMGGNSPTDHALGLASKNLSADWSLDTLKAMTNLARTNLIIRRNSMRNAGVMGASENNPYAPREVAPVVGPNPASGSSAPPVRITGDADWARLAPGTRFIGPDGVMRTK